MDHENLTTTSRCIWVNGPVVVPDRAHCIASLWQSRTYDRLKLHLPKQLPIPEYPTKRQCRKFNECVQSALFGDPSWLWRLNTVERVMPGIIRYTGANEPIILGEGACVLKHNDPVESRLYSFSMAKLNLRTPQAPPPQYILSITQGPVEASARRVPFQAFQYKACDKFAGKRVLVVAAYENSGMEVLLDLCNKNKVGEYCLVRLMEFKTTSRYTDATVPVIVGEGACVLELNVPFVVLVRTDCIASKCQSLPKQIYDTPVFAHQQSWYKQLITGSGQESNDRSSLVTSSTHNNNNGIFTIRMDILPLLSMYLNHNKLDTGLTMTLESYNTIQEIRYYVASHILKKIITTKPNSDVTIVECMHKGYLSRYGFWKKKKVIPQSLQKNQGVDIMGAVKDQGCHQVCWAVVTAEIVSAVRFIRRFDKVKIEYSMQDIVDFTNPEKRSEKKETCHYCYPWHVYEGLKYVSRAGIQREEDRPYQIDCKKEVPRRIPSNLGYIREAIRLETIEDALEVLLKHPVATDIPIFEPEYSEIKHKIYHGPTTKYSTFQGMHAVNIIGGGEENGEKYVLVRSSHGNRIGEDGNLKVSIETMMVCVTFPRTPEEEYYSRPRPLLSQFTFPKLLSTRKENTRKMNEYMF